MTDKTTDNQAENRQVVYLSPFSDMAGTGTPEEEIDLLEIWNVLWRRKFFIIGISLLATLVAGYVTFFVLPVTYQSQAVLLPNSSNDSSKLAGLVGSLPIPISLPGEGSNNLVLIFLQSRDLKQKLIEKYDLLPRLDKYGWRNWELAKKILPPRKPEDMPTAISVIQQNKMEDFYQVSQDTTTQLITVSWVDEDPAFSAEMLKRVLAELDHYLESDYVSDAKRERMFVEKQLADATKELEQWEQQVPTSEITLAKIKRENLAASAVYAELRKQVELARFTEEKEVINFKTIDNPFVPDEKYRPKRALICALALVMGGGMAVIFVLIRNGLARHGKKQSEGLVI